MLFHNALERMEVRSSLLRRGAAELYLAACKTLASSNPARRGSGVLRAQAGDGRSLPGAHPPG